MLERKLFMKFFNVVNTNKQCSLRDMHTLYNILSFDLSLMHDFNTVRYIFNRQLDFDIGIAETQRSRYYVLQHFLQIM